MNKELNERIDRLADRINKLENANIVYGREIIDPSDAIGVWQTSAKSNKVVEKLLDHLGITFSTRPATEEDIVIIDKKITD